MAVWATHLIIASGIVRRTARLRGTRQKNIMLQAIGIDRRRKPLAVEPHLELRHVRERAAPASPSTFRFVLFR